MFATKSTQTHVTDMSMNEDLFITDLHFQCNSFTNSKMHNVNKPHIGYQKHMCKVNKLDIVNHVQTLEPINYDGCEIHQKEDDELVFVTFQLSSVFQMFCVGCVFWPTSFFFVIHCKC